MVHSSSQPAFTENSSRTFNFVFDGEDGSGKREVGTGGEPSLNGRGKESFPSIKFTIGEVEEGDGFVPMERNGQITFFLGGGDSGNSEERQLQQTYIQKGHFDLGIMDTCRRSASMNDLIYHSPGELSLQQTNNFYTPRNLSLNRVGSQAAGFLLCA